MGLDILVSQSNCAMNISLSEVWNFSNLIGKGEEGWSYYLQAGEILIEDISQEALISLKNDPDYDTELLPSIFTFREILWQPDVFTEAGMSLPGLRILHAFCMEVVADYQEQEKPTLPVYAKLLSGLAACCEKAVKSLEENHSSVNKVLGDLRTAAFPIIKFFIFHPQNRPDYHQDAVNRLNYAVKVMLTQFHGRYTELKDPYWKVVYEQPKTATLKEPINQQKEIKEG